MLTQTLKKIWVCIILKAYTEKNPIVHTSKNIIFMAKFLKYNLLEAFTDVQPIHDE